MIYKSNSDGAKKARAKKKRAARFLAVILVLAALAASAFALIAYSELSGRNYAANGAAVTVDIPEGSSTGAVASLLKDAGVIGSVNGFKLYCRVTGADGSFQYGAHELLSGDYKTVVETLQQPAKRETVTVTFPEGYTTLKMAEELEELGICSVEDFIAACELNYDVGFFSEIPNDPNLFIRLEGYLRPDTYAFFVDSSPSEIIELMLQNFEQKTYTDELKAALKASGRTLHQAVTLGSMIQKEAFSGEEYNVSSVLNNRLAEGSPIPCLELDTTWYYIYYVLDYYYGGRGEAPKELRDAYNSDLVEGFIAGPICNPGAHSIMAALTPAETPYYYFLTDNNKKFYYAETREGHEQNIKIMDEVNAAIEAENEG